MFMDLSKLPRLSETDKQAPQPPSTADAPTSAPEPVRSHFTPAPLGSGADVWISLAVGVILLLMYPRFLQWTGSRIFGTSFNEFTLDGVVVPYPQVPEFWSDLGPTLFGIVLLLEGIALLFAHRRPAVLWAAFGMTVAATAFNAIYLIVTFSKYGLAIVSAIAVALGVYIAMGQWRMLQLIRR
jgi:hypothetical protein